MGTVRVHETFVSIQGESSLAGFPCFFIRLAGCNLNCVYCDTPEARTGGRETGIDALVEEARAANTPLIEVTGGEPLLQEGFAELARGLCALPGRVLVETNGTCDISVIPDAAVAVVDVKCPGSGAADTFAPGNLDRLRPQDELKFVLCGREDYDWARAFVTGNGLVPGERAVHFSPAAGRLEPRELAAWLVQDGLPVRLQLQLHRILGIR